MGETEEVDENSEAVEEVKPVEKQQQKHKQRRHWKQSQWMQARMAVENIRDDAQK